MIDAYLNLQQALDDEYYRVVIESYYSDTNLAFLLAYLCLMGCIPNRKSFTWAYSGSINRDDLLFSKGCRSPFQTIDHFDMFLQYLQSPRRSKQYSIKAAGGRLYSTALLYYLHSVQNTEVKTTVSYRPSSTHWRESLRSYDQNDKEILSQWTQNGSQDEHEDEWRGATDTALNPSNYLESLQTLYEDDQTDLHYYRERSNIGIFGGRYGPAMGICLLYGALFFFPRAARCDKLLHLCNTKYLPKNVFPLKEEEMVFRAMDAYVERWKDGGSGSPEVDEWAYPLPLVEKRVSIFTDEEKEAILKLRAQSSK